MADDSLQPRADVPDLDALADQLVADAASAESSGFLDAVGTFASWETRLETND